MGVDIVYHLCKIEDLSIYSLECDFRIDGVMENGLCNID